MPKSARFVIVGAGPAGASLAYLLASRGLEVVLLERQLDFAREFRGEILTTSGVRALTEMGLGEALAAVPTKAPARLELFLNRRRVLDLEPVAEWFDGDPPVAVSQPALLEALVAACSRHAGFRFERGATALDLVRGAGRVAGVRARTGDGEREFCGDLVIGADGRASLVRRKAALRVLAQDVPMDIVWCKMPCPEFVTGVRAYAGRAHLLVAYRTWDEALQLGWVIVKGGYRALKARGMASWVEEMAGCASPDLAGHLRAHGDAVRHPFVLDCRADRVEPWGVPGALTIGDAAHTMSPVGGQGLNIALRDAIVAANHLVPAAARGDAAALDTAAQRIEAERRPEVEVVQTRQAQPPRVVLSDAWWGEPVRRVAAAALSTSYGRGRLLPLARLFQFGVTEVRLKV